MKVAWFGAKEVKTTINISFAIIPPRSPTFPTIHSSTKITLVLLITMVMLVITETMVRLVILVSTVALVITLILVILVILAIMVRWRDSQAATATGATWGKRRGRPPRLCSPGKEICSRPTIPSSKYPLTESQALNNLQHSHPLIPPASLTSLSTTPCRGRRRRWRWWPTSSWRRLSS